MKLFSSPVKNPFYFGSVYKKTTILSCMKKSDAFLLSRIVNKNIHLVGQAWADQRYDRISFCFFFSSEDGVWKHNLAFNVISF